MSLVTGRTKRLKSHITPLIFIGVIGTANSNKEKHILCDFMACRLVNLMHCWSYLKHAGA